MCEAIVPAFIMVGTLRIYCVVHLDRQIRWNNASLSTFLKCKIFDMPILRLKPINRHAWRFIEQDGKLSIARGPAQVNASTAADIQLLTKSEVMLLSGALEKFSTRIYLSFASFFGVNNLLEGISQHRHLNHLDSVLFSKE